MIGSLFNLKHLPIAVDIGGSHMRLVQLDRNDSEAGVLAAACVPLEDYETPGSPQWRDALTAALRTALASAPFRGRQCAVCLPDALVQYKNLRLPRMPADEMAQAVNFDARERFELADTGAVIQHVVAGEVTQGEDRRQEIIAMAITDEAVTPLLAALDAVGLTPVSIEATPTAIARCFARFCGDDDEAVRVFIDAGYCGAKVLIARGAQVTFYKRLDIGGRQLNEAVAKTLELSYDEAQRLRRRRPSEATGGGGEGGGETEAEPLFGSTRRQNVDRAVFDAARPLLQELVKEIGLCLRYHAVTFRGKRPECVILSGGESTDPLLNSILAEQLDLPVEAVDPFDAVTVNDAASLERTGAHPAAWSVAMGVAFRQPFATGTMTRGAA